MERFVIPVQIHETWIAVEAACVRAVLGAEPWVPLPAAPPHLPGVLPWRGRAVAVLDLGALAGIAVPLRRGEIRPRCLVAELRNMTFAVPVAAVREVHVVSAADLSAPHATRCAFSVGEMQLDGVILPLVSLAEALGSLLGTVS